MEEYATDLKNTTVVEFDGEIFLSSCDTNKKLESLYKYNLQSKRQVLLFSSPNKSDVITDMAVCSDYIAAIDRDNKAIKLYIRRSQAVSTVKVPGLNELYRLSFSYDGKFLLVSGLDLTEIDRLNKYRLSTTGVLSLVWSCDECPEVRSMRFDDHGLLYVNGKENRRIFTLTHKGLEF